MMLQILLKYQRSLHFFSLTLYHISDVNLFVLSLFNRYVAEIRKFSDNRVFLKNVSNLTQATKWDEDIINVSKQIDAHEEDKNIFYHFLLEIKLLKHAPSILHWRCKRIRSIAQSWAIVWLIFKPGKRTFLSREHKMTVALYLHADCSNIELVYHLSNRTLKLNSHDLGSRSHGCWGLVFSHYHRNATMRTLPALFGVFPSPSKTRESETHEPITSQHFINCGTTLFTSDINLSYTF
ncbi:predicted protein [Clavispora lusitaniae ATCC 42720]|uniref:Uncharacterized protein n=1 Tax=Clavispora lusitaniae (strain ATCC 42720) TaxID=306902 RepID=C4YCJ7_CLAL4|nr:uncharacterized protein CLUG_05925 [Clavispora lusitaniae ATCC 42720]EEQ41797.1 predicted protein [Clavispora lusitaniae ATCC 42720]